MYPADPNRPARMSTNPLEVGRRRDDAADEVARARANWHTTRTRVDAAKWELHQAIRAQVHAEIDYRAAVAAYEAVR